MTPAMIGLTGHRVAAEPIADIAACPAARALPPPRRGEVGP